MQQQEQANSSQKNNQRNPEVAVCQDGFEHNLSLLLCMRAHRALYAIAVNTVKSAQKFAIHLAESACKVINVSDNVADFTEQLSIEKNP
jgi:hypothetical protein